MKWNKQKVRKTKQKESLQGNLLSKREKNNENDNWNLNRISSALAKKLKKLEKQLKILENIKEL